MTGGGYREVVAGAPVEGFGLDEVDGGRLIHLYYYIVFIFSFYTVILIFYIYIVLIL